MIRSISGALSLMLTIVVLRLVLPEVASLVVEIIIKLLTFANKSLDVVLAQQPL